MVLVFDMVFSLWAPIDGASFKTTDSGFIPGIGFNASNFGAAQIFESLWLD